MSYSDARIAIESRFNTEWASATTVYYTGQRGKPEADENWVRLMIRPASRNQVSFGPTPLFRTVGTIWISIFTAEDENNSVRDTLIENAANVFQAQQFAAGSGTVLCSTAEIEDVGKDATWFMANVKVSYQHDEYKAI